MHTTFTFHYHATMAHCDSATVILEAPASYTVPEGFLFFLLITVYCTAVRSSSWSNGRRKGKKGGRERGREGRREGGREGGGRE